MEVEADTVGIPMAGITGRPLQYEMTVTPFRLPAEVAKSDEQLNTGKGQAHWHSQD